MGVKPSLLWNRNFWELNPASSGSWIWRKLCKLRPLARPFIVCEVGAGITAKFWHDNWTGLGPLIDVTGPRGPQIVGMPIDVVVRDALRGRDWWLSSSRSRNPVILLLRSVLPCPGSVFESQQDDTYLWKSDQHAPTNRFSAAGTWLALNPPAPPVPWSKSVWFKGRIPKHAFIAWVVSWNRLHTRDRLRSWGLNIPSICLLCSNQDETRDHLFFECTYSLAIWSFFTLRTYLTPPGQFMDCLIWIQTASRNKNLSLIIKLLFQACIYSIWRERNRRLHSSNLRSTDVLIKEIQVIIRAKLDPLSREQHCIPPAVSLLSSWFSFFQFR